MKSVAIVSDASFAEIGGVDEVYLTARSTASSSRTFPVSIKCGQEFIPGIMGPDAYGIYRSFLKFDTSVVPNNATIIRARLRLALMSYLSNYEFDVQIVKYDWSAQDPVDSGNRQDAYDGCLSAALDSIWRTIEIGSNIGFTGIFYSNDLDLARIDKSGNTYYGLRSSRDFNAQESRHDWITTATVNTNILANRPALIVDFIEEPDEYEGMAFQLFVDWDGTQDEDSWQDEAPRLYKYVVDRGRDRPIGSPGQGFEAPKPGKAIIELDNFDGRYDPRNTSSPLYGKIRPGRRCNLAYWHDSEYYNLITGFIADIRPRGYRDRVTMTIEDGAGWLRSRTPNVPLELDGDAGTAINAILDNLEYPFGRNVDAGINPLPYYWTSGGNGLTEIDRVAASDLGRFAVLADSQVRFINRYDESTDCVHLSETQLGRDIMLPMPWDYTRSLVDIYTFPRTEGSSDSTIWELRDSISIGVENERTIWAEYTFENIAVPAYDVYIDSYSSTDIPSTDIVLTAFSRDAKIDINNPTTDTNYTLSELVLKGTPIISPNPSKIRKESTDTESIPASFEFRYDWLVNYNIANAYSTVLLDYLSEAKEYPEVQIQNRPEISGSIDIEDKVELDLPTLDIDDTYYVYKLTHRSGPKGIQELFTTLKMYPILQAVTTDTARWDEGLWDESTWGF